MKFWKKTVKTLPFKEAVSEGRMNMDLRMREGKPHYTLQGYETKLRL